MVMEDFNYLSRNSYIFEIIIIFDLGWDGLNHRDRLKHAHVR